MKEKKGMITHIVIISIILIILAVSVYKLVKWNQGNPDAGAITTDENFDTEPEDYIAALNPDLLKEDDGKTTIVFLGDDILGKNTGKDSIPEQAAAMIGPDTVVYNCGFDGMYMSATSTAWDDANSKDAFSLYWLTKSITLNDYSLLENVADEVNKDFKPIIKTLQGIDFNDVDVITIMYGVHDYLDGRLVTNVADHSDPAAYSGALKASAALIKEAYPHIRIVVMAPTFCRLEQDGKTVNCDVTNTGYGTLPDYMIASKAIAVDENFTLLDNYYGVDINADTYEKYLEDNIHPNAEGRKLIAARLAKLLTTDHAITE